MTPEQSVAVEERFYRAVLRVSFQYDRSGNYGMADILRRITKRAYGAEEQHRPITLNMKPLEFRWHPENVAGLTDSRLDSAIDHEMRFLCAVLAQERLQ